MPKNVANFEEKNLFCYQNSRTNGLEKNIVLLIASIDLKFVVVLMFDR